VRIRAFAAVDWIIKEPGWIPVKLGNALFSANRHLMEQNEKGLGIQNDGNQGRAEEL
jgi:hypothetical protein